MIWLATYVGTRCIALALLVPQIELLADFTHYGKALANAGATGSLFEYPWLAAEVLELPLRLGSANWPQYYGALIVVFLFADAAYAIALWRAGGPSRGFFLWLLVAPVLGPLIFTRFDGLAAAFAGTALLSLAAARPTNAGVLSMLGAAIKIWPVFEIPALLAMAAPEQRRKLVVALLATGAFVAGATLLSAGPARLLSPFLLQASRGLEVEAIPALPFLWRRLAEPQSATVEHTACNCDELRASGVQTALLRAEIAFWAGLIGFALLYARVLRAPPAVRTPALGAQLALLLTLLWIVTNKVFSPQYMIWAAALMAAWGALRGPALPRADTALLLAACALTQLLYPAHRAELSGSEPQAWPLAALTLRNVLLGAISVRVALQISRETARHG